MSYQYVRIRAWAWPGHTLSNKPMLLLHEAVRRSDEHRSCSLGSSGCDISAIWNNLLFSGCDSGMAKESKICYFCRFIVNVTRLTIVVTKIKDSRLAYLLTLRA